MNIRTGARPTERDKRDYSFVGTFGAAPLFQIPNEYNIDAGFGMPDQNADGNPFSCTAYATCDLGSDQDAIRYCPEYTYMKTLLMQGLPPETNGSDIRPSLKSAKVYGLLPLENKPPIIDAHHDEDFTANQANWPVAVDTIAGKLEHRKGDYFNVWKEGIHDWFDTFCSTMWTNRNDKRGISVGTPWFPLSCPNGIMPDPTAAELAAIAANPYSYSWHNWVVKGWTQHNTKGEFIRNAESFLMVKAWTGPNYGDKGWIYVSRSCIEKLMEIRGAVAFTLKDATDADIKTIKLSIIQQIILYIARIIGIKILA